MKAGSRGSRFAVITALLIWAAGASCRAADASTESQRLNLWPLVYASEGEWYFLGPLIKVSEDNFSLRPLFAVNTENETRLRVLFPFSQVIFGGEPNWIFPFFWGDDYQVGFPLYWHFGQPYGPEKKGYHGVLPLYSYRRSGEDFSLHAPWPLYLSRKWRGEEVQQLWPVYGRHQKADGEKGGFAAWPLLRWWDDPKINRRGHFVLPIYAQMEDELGSRFYSLPWSQGHSIDGEWKFSFPFFFHQKQGADETFISLPWSQGVSGGGDTRWSMAPPLWYHEKNTDSEYWFTLPYISSREGARSSWFSLPLLSGGTKDPELQASWIVAPLGRFEKYADGAYRKWVAPLFYRAGDGKQKDLLITPLYAHGRDTADRSWKTLPPFYYGSCSPEKGVLHATPLGGWRRDADGGLRWDIYPLLTWKEKTADSSSFWALAPLIHSETRAQGKRSHVLPLYSWDEAKQRFLSLAYSAWGDPDSGSQTQLLPWLGSWVTRRPGREDYWILGALAHFSTGQVAGASHIFPIYWSNPAAEAIFTPLWSQWKKGNTRHRLLPPLLTRLDKTGEQVDLWAAGGLIHQQWGIPAAQREEHVLPFYYRDGREVLYTPLFGWNREGENPSTYFCTPLVGRYEGKYRGGWLFPLLRHKVDRATGYYRDRILFLGQRWKNRDARGNRFWPIYKWETTDRVRPLNRGGEKGSRSIKRSEGSMLLLANYRREEVQLSLQDGSPLKLESRSLHHGIWPLWSHRNREYPKEASRNRNTRLLLGALYHGSNETRGDDQQVRHSLLWKLWDYRRDNEKVSVDVFPFITYDRAEDGSKESSFLWRFFRHKRSADGGRELDLLFIPVLR